jgi:hypothetical protein
MSNKITLGFSIEVEEDLVLFLPTINEAEELFYLIQKNRKYLREFLGWLDSFR